MRSTLVSIGNVGWLALCVLSVACDNAHIDETVLQPGVEIPTVDEIQRLTDDQLLAQQSALSAYAKREAGEDGIVAARGVAEIARARTRRSGDVSHVQAASALLREVASQRAGDNACGALLDAVRLQLVELSQLALAERAARDLTARFADDARAQACVATAQRIVDTLGDHPAVVAAALDEARRPAKVELTVPAHHDVPDVESAAWIQTQKSDATADAATLQRITVYGGRAGTRVVRAVLYFDRPVLYRAGEAQAEAGLPRRLYLDFDAIKVAEQVEATVPIAQGGLQRIRLLSLDGRDLQTASASASASASRMRVSFDVDAAVARRLFFLSDPYRVVIDLQVQEPPNALLAKVRTIVLDPGHGGRNLGAHGPHGLREAVVALDLSRRVRALLRHELPGTRVVLTRETNEDLSLEERTAIANGENAQLFVSIHLNAWATTEQGGVATFVLDTSDDSQALRLAARENGTEVNEVSQLQKVLAGLYRKEQVSQSLKLADAIHQQTLSSSRAVLPNLQDRGVKRAMFYVLVGATMPAVLVEPSFITNPDEAQALTTDAYRDRIAAGIARGIATYARSL